MNYVTRANQTSYFTDNELRDLRKLKVNAKISDADYVSAHPEIGAIIEDLYMRLLRQKPDDVYPFVSRYFVNLYDEYCNAC